MLEQVVHQEPDLLRHLQRHLACILAVQDAHLQRGLLLVAKRTAGFRESLVTPDGSGDGKQRHPGRPWPCFCSTEVAAPCPTEPQLRGAPSKKKTKPAPRAGPRLPKTTCPCYSSHPPQRITSLAAALASTVGFKPQPLLSPLKAQSRAFLYRPLRALVVRD